MTIWLAVLAGGALGFVLASGDFCFHATWRRFFADDRDISLVKAYVVMLIVATPIVQLLQGTDVIHPYVPPFAPAGAIVGGLVFGGGMVIAQTCTSGMFYKLGAGMLGMVVAITGWAIGDLITWRGPLKGVRESLTDNPINTTADDGTTQAATLLSAMGIVGVLLVLALLGVAVWWVANDTTIEAGSRSRSPLANNSIGLGVAAAIAMGFGWLLVAWHGGDYAYGTAGVPNQIWDQLFGDGGGSMWIPLTLISIVPGAFLAANMARTLWVRAESTRRYVQLGGGGLVMGVGAAIAGGCNLGHAMVGVPLLSVGSIVTTLAIIGGVFIGDRVTRRVAHQPTGPPRWPTSDITGY